MPTYTYACKQCGHRFDQRQSFTDPALTVCPQCEGSLRKVLNSVGVVFKGSGFYRTDSRSKTTSTSPATSKTKPSKGSTSSSTTTASSGSTTPAAKESTKKPATAAA